MRSITISSNNLIKSIQTKELLKNMLLEEGFFVFDNINDDTDLIISIGGDGSFLKTIRDF